MDTNSSSDGQGGSGLSRQPSPPSIQIKVESQNSQMTQDVLTDGVGAGPLDESVVDNPNDSASEHDMVIDESMSSSQVPKPKSEGERKPRVKLNNAWTSSKFNNVCHAREEHCKPIYGASFYLNKRIMGDFDIFATVGSNCVTVYKCPKEGTLEVLQVFKDPDPEEAFYVCAWTDDEAGMPLLAAAGSRGFVRIFSPNFKNCTGQLKTLTGHGATVNDLVFNPKDGNLLLSCSKDRTLRLWNIKTDICVAIFGGSGQSHESQVLSVDIDLEGTRIVSSGMDNVIKVWKLKTTELTAAVALSYEFKPENNEPFPTVKEFSPHFSSGIIHRDFIDCVKWFGDFIFSKSCDGGNIILWKGGKLEQSWDQVTDRTQAIIQKLEITDCDIWYIRFSLNNYTKILALGNKNGTAYVYDLNVDSPEAITPKILSHPECRTTIRQTAMSRDGSILICVCDNGTIWRWDKSI